MVSPVDIANEALADIGAQSTVSSIKPSDGTAAGDLISLTFDQRVRSLARAAHWNCFRAQTTLTLYAAAAGSPENPNSVAPFPPQPWCYEYLLPTDCLDARFILPFINTAPQSIPLTTAPNAAVWSGVAPNEPIPFEIGLDVDTLGNPIRVLLTNVSQAVLVYTREMLNPQFWDPHFIEAFIAYLGSWIARPLTGNKDISLEKAKEAQMYVAQARASDGNEGVSTVNRVPDFIQIRGISGDFFAGNRFYSYSSLTFPGMPNF